MSGRPVRLVVFDFDQTLSVYHVFKHLAGWGGGSSSFRVPAPHASSEAGQVLRVVELSEGEFREAGGFAPVAFGGVSRVKEVLDLLFGLRAAGAELLICTKGNVGVVRKCLKDLDMLQYFGEVYGNIGDNYGQLAYDKKVVKGRLAEDLQALLGAEHQAGWGSKDSLISKLMRSRRLSHGECVLVEDDPDEIRRADPVCRTVYVQEARGVTKDHAAVLLRMARGEEPEGRRGGGGAAGGRGGGGAAVQGRNDLHRPDAADSNGSGRGGMRCAVM